MGNPDVVIIFNDKHTFIIKGKDYNSKAEAIKNAIEEYEEKRKREEAEYYKCLKENPSMVDEEFNVTEYWEIKNIRIYEKNIM